MSGAMDREVLSVPAKAVLGAWFCLMKPGGGELTLQLRESKPTAIVQTALDELVRAGFICVEPFNRYGGLVYRSLVDNHWALGWLHKNRENPEVKIRMVEPVASEKDARTHQRAALRALASQVQNG